MPADSQTSIFYEAVIREGQAADADFIEEMRCPLEERLFKGTVAGPFTVDGTTLTPMSGPLRMGKLKLESGSSVLILTAETVSTTNLWGKKNTAKSLNEVQSLRHNSITLKTPPADSEVYLVEDYMNFSQMLMGSRLKESEEIISQKTGTPPTKNTNQDAVTKAYNAALSGKDFIGIKGPPGTGKTHLLAKVALDLALRGQSVTITAPSHSAVNNALAGVAAAREADLTHYQNIDLVKTSGSMLGLERTSVINLKDLGLKGKQKRERLEDPGTIIGATINSLSGTLNSGYYDEWQRQVLIVDEAGQLLMMQLAAIDGFYQRAIFFGDEAQLAPVKKASHDPYTGAGDSCMEYLIRQRGMDWVFPLETTYRLNQPICALIQENFYPGIALHPANHTKSRIETSACSPALPFSGVDFIDVPHKHACTRSDAEIEAIKELINELLQNGQLDLQTEAAGKRKITFGDFAVLAPFRNQVSGLEAALSGLGIDKSQIGTVDKMQGQGRPIVIYSCATSSLDVLAEQAEFIFSPNRWNVLLSRAMAQCYVVGSRDCFLAAPSQTLNGLRHIKQITHMLRRLPSASLTNGAHSTPPQTPSATPQPVPSAPEGPVTPQAIPKTPTRSASKQSASSGQPPAATTQFSASDPLITIDSRDLDVAWQPESETGHTHQKITLKKSQWQQVCKWLERGCSPLRITDRSGNLLVDGFPNSKAIRIKQVGDIYWRTKNPQNLQLEIEGKL